MSDLPRYPFYDGHVQERVRRASGDCVCERCGLKYWRHPFEESIIGWMGLPFLHRLCDGSLVKL